MRTLFNAVMVLSLCCCSRSGPTQEDAPDTVTVKHTFVATHNDVPWDAMSDCDIGVILCKMPAMSGSSLERNVYCGNLSDAVRALFGDAAMARYGGRSLGEIFASIRSSGGLGRGRTEERVCATMLATIERSGASRTDVENAWRATQATTCMDSCFEHELPQLSDCVPSVMMDTAEWRSRRCMFRMQQDKPRVDDSVEYCRKECELGALTEESDDRRTKTDEATMHAVAHQEAIEAEKPRPVIRQIGARCGGAMGGCDAGWHCARSGHCETGTEAEDDAIVDEGSTQHIAAETSPRRGSAEAEQGADNVSDSRLKEISQLARATASSTLPDDLGFDFGPANTLDGTLDTSWQPSAKGRRGAGEWIEFSFARAHNIAKLEVANGFQSVWEGRDLFLMNSRLRKTIVEVDDDTFEFVFRSDRRGMVAIPIEPPRMATRIRIRAKSTYPGTRWPDLAVSEVRIFADEP